ncbi:hypothetical protein KUCAC02_011692, partial [Chaenocephalus aceratus]
HGQRLSSLFTPVITVPSCSEHFFCQQRISEPPTKTKARSDTQRLSFEHTRSEAVTQIARQVKVQTWLLIESVELIAADHFGGQRAQLLLLPLSENDTHCIQFSYFLYSRDGHSPGDLQVFIRVNGGPKGSAVWNISGSQGRQWHQVELAVSTFWPSEYQPSEVEVLSAPLRPAGVICWLRELDGDLYRQISGALWGRAVIFEAAVSEERQGYIALDDIVLLNYPCCKYLFCTHHSTPADLLSVSGRKWPAESWPESFRNSFP